MACRVSIPSVKEDVFHVPLDLFLIITRHGGLLWLYGGSTVLLLFVFSVMRWGLEFNIRAR